jgi:hypothetical protein
MDSHAKACWKSASEWNTGRLAERRDISFVIASASNMA